MINKLAPKTTLPYKQIRGPITQREQAAIQLVDKFYKNFSQKFDNKGQVPFNELQKTIDEIFEKKINIKTKSTIDDEFDGFSDIIYSPFTGKIIATTLEVFAPKGKLNIKDLVSIIHEFQHIADQVYNPKYLVRNQYMANNTLFTHKYNNLYDNHIYKREYFETKKEKRKILKKLEYRIRNFLRGKSTEEKINYIQDTRYTLTMEDQAYRTQRKYAKQLKKKYHPLNDYDLINENKIHMFQEKIELLKRLGFEIIQKERTKHKAKLSKAKNK